MSSGDRRLPGSARHGAVGHAEQALAGGVNLVVCLLQVAGNERHRGTFPLKPKPELLERVSVRCGGLELGAGLLQVLY
jgi:hypothetical protein